jgi:hypothetical protein
MPWKVEIRVTAGVLRIKCRLSERGQDGKVITA